MLRFTTTRTICFATVVRDDFQKSVSALNDQREKFGVNFVNINAMQHRRRAAFTQLLDRAENVLGPQVVNRVCGDACLMVVRKLGIAGNEPLTPAQAGRLLTNWATSAAVLAPAADGFASHAPQSEQPERVVLDGSGGGCRIDPATNVDLPSLMRGHPQADAPIIDVTGLTPEQIENAMPEIAAELNARKERRTAAELDLPIEGERSVNVLQAYGEAEAARGQTMEDETHSLEERL